MLGIPWDDVHEEAERLEHAMSPKLEERMLAAIGDAKTCPHGHPLSPGDRIQGVPLADVSPGASVKVLRFENEAEDLLHLFKAEGSSPASRAPSPRAERERSSDDVRTTARSARSTADLAETVSVTADPSPPQRTALPEQLVISQGQVRPLAEPKGSDPFIHA